MSDSHALALGFHALRAVQQRLHTGWLDEVFCEPLRDRLGDEVTGNVAREGPVLMSRRTRDALRLLCTRLIDHEAPETIIDAVEQFACRLRIDGLHKLSMDGLLVLIDALDGRDDEKADEWRCIVANLSLSENDPETCDSMTAMLGKSEGRHAPAYVALLDANRKFIRGNLLEAERAAIVALSLVDRETPSTAASLAFHVFGVIVGTQGRHREAADALFEAYVLAPDPFRAQWALVCLAVGLFCLGRIEAAADCCALLADSESVTIRAAAAINAVRIAGRRGQVAEVTRLRSELEPLLDRQILLPHSQTNLCYLLGAALDRIGDFESAVALWSRGLSVARAHQINQMLYVLDAALVNGHAHAEALGPLPLPVLHADPSLPPDAGLAIVESRLHEARVARELQVMT